MPPLSVSWLANNLSGHWKRAFGAGIQVALGGISGVLATNIFIEHEAPRYLTGYGTALALNWLGGIAATVLFAGMLRENKKKWQDNLDISMDKIRILKTRQGFYKNDIVDQLKGM